MRGLKGLSKLVVVAMTAATMILVAAVGAAAASGTFGSATAMKSVLTALSITSARDKDGHKCKGEGDDHDNSTPGHKHHPCDDGGHSGGGD